MPNWRKVIISGSSAHLNSVTASSAVSASGDLFANLADNNDSNFKTVVYDDSTGQFHTTGSYGGGGSGKYESGTGTGGIKPTEGSNTNSGQYSTIAGGKSNSISGTQGYALTGSFIGGGEGNTINQAECSSILGGQSNILSGSYDGAEEGPGLSQIKWSSILGGCGNSITGSSNSGGITDGNNGCFHTIVGGEKNSIFKNSKHNFIGGGRCNSIEVGFGYGGSNIIGGCRNKITGGYVNSIVGGCGNCMVGDHYGSTIAGGVFNCIKGGDSSKTIVGGEFNVVDGRYATIGGGSGNCINSYTGVLVGGRSNLATGNYDVVVGGRNNTSSNARDSVLVGGRGNFIVGEASVIGGGCTNYNIGNCAVVVGGMNNSGSADFSSILGGKDNTITAAACSSSILGGVNNCITHDNAFIIGSSITSSADNTLFVNNICLYGTNGSNGSILGGADIVLSKGTFGTATTIIDDNISSSGYLKMDGAITASADISSSGTIQGNHLRSNSLTSGNVVLAGTNGRLEGTTDLTYNTTNKLLSSPTASFDHLIVSQIISSSVINTSGSNIFGDASNDTQTLNGSVIINNASTQASETTALMINGSNIVGTRDLGTNAFTSTTIGTTTNNLTVDDTTIQLNSGTTFNGSAARTISAKTAAITEAGDGLATSAQIYTFVTGLGYGEGTVTSVGTNTGLSGTVTTSGNLSLALADLADMTQAWDNSADEFIVLDGGTQKRKLSSEIFGSNAFTSTSIPTAASDIGALAVSSNLSDLNNASTARDNLGLGSFATISSLAFASLTSKPTTIAGYGITDALQIGTTATTALAGNTTVGTVVTGNGGGSGDTLSTISIGGTTFTVATGTGNGTVTSVGGTGTVNGLTLTGTVTNSGNLTLGGTLSVDLASSDVTGTLPVGNGGTGLTTLTSGQIPYGNGTSAFNSNGAFVFDQSVKQLQLTGDSSNAPLKLTNVQANAEETKVGLILNSTNDGVEKATLGSNAFTSTTIPTNNNQLANGAGYITSVGTINLASGVTGILPVANGGTGVDTLDSIGLTEFDNDANFYAANDTIRAANGTSTAPGLSFNNDNDTGFYSSNPNELSISIGTNQIGYFNSNGLQVTVSGQTSQFSGHLQAHCLGIGTAPSTVSGEIRAAGDVTANYSSDKRLKKNIKSISGALDKLSTINGVEFDWIEKEGVHSHKGHDVGVIAQEVEKVLPEVVVTRDNGYKAVNYEKIIPLLIESIKDLKAEIDELKKSK